MTLVCMKYHQLLKIYTQSAPLASLYQRKTHHYMPTVQHLEYWLKPSYIIILCHDSSYQEQVSNLIIIVSYSLHKPTLNGQALRIDAIAAIELSCSPKLMLQDEGKIRELIFTSEKILYLDKVSQSYIIYVFSTIFTILVNQQIRPQFLTISN